MRNVTGASHAPDHNRRRVQRHGPDVARAYRSIRDLSKDIGTTLDPIGMAAPILHAQVAWMLHPQELVERLVVLQSDLFQLHWHSLHRMLGLQHEEPVQPNPDDNRFNDPVWAESPTWDLVKDWYLTFTHRAQDMLYDTPALSARERRRAAFWWRKWLNAVAPTNFLWTNPVALRKAFETHGQSVMSGWQNFIADVQAGDVQMTAQANFEVGVNLATTSGAVVFRNNLLEVIHYTPTQPRIHAEPVVIVTPWINKFYILDLNPKKSMVRYLLDQGLDVFITSWRNPGPEMAETRFDDYLLDGVDTIVRVAREMSGAQRVHAVGYCIGGTALSIYMAWANSHYGADAMPVADWTLFTTLVDFRKPGDIEVFIDEGSVKHLCDQMGTRGYLDGREMAAAFRLLRSNSLIWHYVVHGWLYGESPAPFDVLFWNMDSTRMPRAMHSWYLTELYLHNRLVERGALTLAGESIDLTRITQPLYAVAAEDDHIAPWEQTFHVMNHVAGEKRYVLSSSGHILGIVNPPVKPPKRTFLAGEAHRADTPGAWKDRSPTKAGSWWEDWMAWLKPRAGELMEARPVVTKAYPRLADAPGTFVREA